MAERLNDFTKAILRARLLEEGGAFTRNKEAFETIVSEAGAYIDADKLTHTECEEPLPVFGGGTAAIVSDDHVSEEEDAFISLNEGKPE